MSWQWLSEVLLLTLLLKLLPTHAIGIIAMFGFVCIPNLDGQFPLPPSWVYAQARANARCKEFFPLLLLWKSLPVWQLAWLFWRSWWLGWQQLWCWKLSLGWGSLLGWWYHLVWVLYLIMSSSSHECPCASSHRGEGPLSHINALLELDIAVHLVVSW